MIRDTFGQYFLSLIYNLNAILYLQLRLIAYDSAYPTNRATADVFISVTRDEFGPVFQPSATYQITIPESTAIGNNIITVLAVDQDANDIVTYEMVNATSNGTAFFYLDPDTGSITLRQTLLGTFVNFYTVCYYMYFHCHSDLIGIILLNCNSIINFMI